MDSGYTLLGKNTQQYRCVLLGTEYRETPDVNVSQQC